MKPTLSNEGVGWVADDFQEEFQAAATAYTMKYNTLHRRTSRKGENFVMPLQYNDGSTSSSSWTIHEFMTWHCTQAYRKLTSAVIFCRRSSDVDEERGDTTEINLAQKVRE